MNYITSSLIPQDVWYTISRHLSLHHWLLLSKLGNQLFSSGKSILYKELYNEEVDLDFKGDYRKEYFKVLSEINKKGADYKGNETEMTKVRLIHAAKNDHISMFKKNVSLLKTMIGESFRDLLVSISKNKVLRTCFHIHILNEVAECDSIKVLRYMLSEGSDITRSRMKHYAYAFSLSLIHGGIEVADFLLETFGIEIFKFRPRRNYMSGIKVIFFDKEISYLSVSNRFTKYQALYNALDNVQLRKDGRIIRHLIMSDKECLRYDFYRTFTMIVDTKDFDLISFAVKVDDSIDDTNNHERNYRMMAHAASLGYLKIVRYFHSLGINEYSGPRDAMAQACPETQADYETPKVIQFLLDNDPKALLTTIMRYLLKWLPKEIWN